MSGDSKDYKGGFNFMNTVTMKAYAKINVGLDVLGTRPNGYHDVKMVMQTVDLHDTLKFTLLQEDVIRISTSRSDLECDERNLVYKAIALMKREFGVKKGMEVFLEKNIPMAAGMAGGSTDCAAALKACNQMFELHLSDDALMEYGVKLGADVPYCIMGGTALAEGIGEQLTKLPDMPDCYILIAKPPVDVSTKEVYCALDSCDAIVHPDIDGMVKAIKDENLEGVVTRMGNVLEQVTIPMHPAILKITDLMRTAGAKNAMMTGSGPTVFGIYTNEELAQDGRNSILEAGLAKEVYVARPI